MPQPDSQGRAFYRVRSAFLAAGPRSDGAAAVPGVDALCSVRADRRGPSGIRARSHRVAIRCRTRLERRALQPFPDHRNRRTRLAGRFLLSARRVRVSLTNAEVTQSPLGQVELRIPLTKRSNRDEVPHLL